MSRKVKAAAIQMRCSNNVGDNIKKADEMTREAVKKGDFGKRRGDRI